MAERQEAFQTGLAAAEQQGTEDANNTNYSFVQEITPGLDAEYRALQAFTRALPGRQYQFQGNEIHTVRDAYMNAFDQAMSRSNSPAAGGKRRNRHKTKRSHRRHKRRPTHRKLRR